MNPISAAENVLLGLKNSPALLFLFLINLVMLAMVTYLTVQSAQLRFQERAELLKALQECNRNCVARP